MPTRATMHRSVDPASVSKRLPPRSRACVDFGLLGSGPIDLVVFEAGDGHVVSSKEFQKALISRTALSGRLVVVGYDFTEEARALAAAEGGLLFSERSFFGWTDQSWHANRQRYGVAPVRWTV